MSTGRTGLVLVAIAGLLAVAMTCVLWSASDPGDVPAGDDSPAPTPPTATRVSPKPPPAVGGPPATTAAASVEVEDASFPDGATLTIRGVVSDDTGQGIAAALVAAADRVDFRERHATESGPDGAYELAGLDPSKPWSLSVSADGFLDGPRAEAVVATPTRLELAYDFVLPRRQLGSIEIVTTDANGAAVHHVALVTRLDVRDPDDDGNRSGTQELAPGRYRVVVVADGRAPVVRELDVGPGITRLDLGRGEEASVIEGMLLAPDLTPMRGFVVHARDPVIPAWYGSGSSKTAADGTFRITGLRKFTHTLAVEGEDFAIDGATGVAAPARGVRLVVRDDARVTWRIVYPDAPEIDRSAEVEVWLRHGDRVRRLTTHWKGDNGSATVPGGDEVTLEFRIQGCAPLSRAVRVRPGETADLGDLAPDPAFEVWGRIADAAGRPILNASVVAQIGGTAFTAEWHPNGAFIARGLPRGDGVFTIHAPGFAFARAQFRSGQEEPVVVTLTRGGRLVVRGAASNTTVVATGAGDASFDVRTDDFGEAWILLAAGRWRIETAGRDLIDADVREGATTSVRLVAGAR